MHKKGAQRRFVFACLAPAVILVILFLFIPTINVFRMSLFRTSAISKKQTFIGFENFVKLMDDKNFLQSMQNSILIIVLVTLFTVVLAVLFATLLSRGQGQRHKLFPSYFLHTKYFKYRCYCRYFRCDLQSGFRSFKLIFKSYRT